jgi:tRNA A-37 threonylcarbamoyl transferase component Bud32
MAASPQTLPRRSVALRVNPDYREFLEQRGLCTPADFLALTGVIVSGHPDRHVLRVTLGGDDTVTCFLKRQHRVPLLGRLANLWAGFGFVSHSCREAQLLKQLQRAGVACPEWMAAGEDDQGRAFLLVREQAGAVELRLFLHGQHDAERRRCLARKLGEALAQVHETGFDHPDLYAKHVLVNPRDLGVTLLDWQRSRQRKHLSWQRRWHDLAALHASLAVDLAMPRERLVMLHAYLRASLPRTLVRDGWRAIVERIERFAQRLLRHRHIREQRQSPVAGGVQRLIWLDGEALCVTPELQAALGRQTPHWLTTGAPLGTRQRLRQATVAVPGVAQATLVRRRADWPLRWLWAWLRGKHVQSREVRQAAILFRLQRYGVVTPRLLAFGQKHFPPRRTESFLLTEPPTDTIDFATWLAEQAKQPLWTAQRKRRWALIRATAKVLRRMHEAHCYLGRGATALPLHVRTRQAQTIVLASVEDIHLRRRSGARQVVADLARLRDYLSPQTFNRADALRFLLAYLGDAHRSPAVRRLAHVLSASPPRSLFVRLTRWLTLSPGHLVTLSPCHLPGRATR